MTNCGAVNVNRPLQVTAEMSNVIIASVPIGEGNGATQREIGKIYGIGAASSIGTKLRQAVDDGSIKRRKQMRPFGFAWVYWREAPGPS